jgi:SAM-dependent methyltransferase
MLKPSEFADWQEYYWTYQHTLAKKYLIPMIEAHAFPIDGKKVFEIGCGSGGVIEAFAERSGKAVGIEINAFDYTKLTTPRVQYITADIYDANQRGRYLDLYDIIIFRDVIEHLPKKKEVFDLCDQLLAPNGIIFITFPPFYSPYGAHQQVFSKTILGKLPYTQFLPKSLYLKYVSTAEKGNEAAIHVSKEITGTKTTIASLNNAIRRSAFEIHYQDYYLTRPSFEIRYGVKPRKVQFLKYLPLLREVLVMGVYMILARKN